MMSAPITEQLAGSPRPKRLIRLARAGWVLLAVLLTGIFIAGQAPRFEELVTLCQGDECAVFVLNTEDAAALDAVGVALETYAFFHLAVEILAVILVGGPALIVFLRRSNDWMGLLVAYALLLFSLNFLVEADHSFVVRYPSWLGLFYLLSALATLSFVLLLYLFPDGRFVPGWLRWPALLFAVLALIDPLVRVVVGETATGQLSLVLMLTMLGALILGIAGQIYRYRRVSTSLERQQTKWVIGGLTGMILAIFVYSYVYELAPAPPGRARLITNVFTYSGLFVLLTLFPITLMFSILRYRLWDIDLIIRRTAVYGLLTGALALIYFGSVVVMQNIAQGLTGRAGDSPLIIVASTLLIAALFQPLRRRLQDAIDRRFFRRKYDAAQTLAAFAQSARDEVELEALSGELVRVVQETMQPERVTLWLVRERPERQP